jgi:hypothetical protein
MAYVEQFYDPTHRTEASRNPKPSLQSKLKQSTALIRLYWLKLRTRFRSTTKGLIKKTKPSRPDELEREVSKALLTNIIASRAAHYNASLRQPTSAVPEIYTSVLGEKITNDTGSIGYLSFYGRRVMNHLLLLSYSDMVKNIDELDEYAFRALFDKTKELNAQYKRDNTETVMVWRQNNTSLQIEYLVVQDTKA